MCPHTVIPGSIDNKVIFRYEVRHWTRLAYQALVVSLARESLKQMFARSRYSAA